MLIAPIITQGEMEAQRQEDQDDYWLIQYQRLMDRKPQSLIDQVSLNFILYLCRMK